MSVTWLEAVGLIGVTLVIAKGSIFNPLREFLKSFEHKYNPLPWFGALISCAMCSGWWVGFGWGLLQRWSFPEAIVFGGALSLASLLVGGIVDIVEIEVERKAKKTQGTFTLADLVRYRQEQAEAKKRQGNVKTRAKTIIGEEPSRMPTEEEADKFIEDHNRRADAAP